MCNVDKPKYESTVPKEVIHAPTYADAQTQSAVANARNKKILTLNLIPLVVLQTMK